MCCLGSSPDGGAPGWSRDVWAGIPACGKKTSTLAVVECVQAKTKVADQQRLWVQYRDANCGFYGAQDESIRQVQGAECMRSMTEDRARELEKAMKFD